MKYLIFILLLSCASEQTLIRKQKRMISNVKLHPVHQSCHGGNKLTNLSNETYHTMIDFKVDCEYQCQDEDQRTEEIPFTLDTKFEGMRLGDGSSSSIQFYASFTTYLSQRAKRACFQEAKRKCGLNKIEKMKSAGIQHEFWDHPFYKENLQCIDSEGEYAQEDIFILPYDTKEKSMNPIAVFYNRSQFSQKWLGHPLQHLEFKENQRQSCKTIGEAYTCFGDCISHDSDPDPFKWTGLMGEKKNGYGSAVYEVCLDEVTALVHDLNIKNDDVINYLYEEYYWHIVITEHSQGTSCSAFRGTFQIKSD